MSVSKAALFRRSLAGIKAISSIEEYIRTKESSLANQIAGNCTELFAASSGEVTEVLAKHSTTEVVRFIAKKTSMLIRDRIRAMDLQLDDCIRLASLCKQIEALPVKGTKAEVDDLLEKIREGLSLSREDVALLADLPDDGESLKEFIGQYRIEYSDIARKLLPKTQA